MTDLLGKLNYKGQERIVVINASDSFKEQTAEAFKNVTVDRTIDPRYPYSYMILFVKSRAEVEQITPPALHNLTADGVLWYCYPRKTSKKYSADIDRDNGWNALAESGFQGVRLVQIDEDWSAIRFRNIKYIKSSKQDTSR
jgi:hypothetical protein